MKGVTKYGNTNNEYRITNANAKNILVTNEDERGLKNCVINHITSLIITRYSTKL